MDIKKVDILSKTTVDRRDGLFRWLAAQGDVVRVAVVLEQGEFAARNKDVYQKAFRAEFYYAMLVRAVAKLHWLESSQAQKAALTEDEAQQLSARRRARIKYNAGLPRYKPSPKKELIRVRFFEEIKQLREDGFSWPNVAKFLKEYRKASFGHTYLKAIYEALEKERALEAEGPNSSWLESSQAQKAELAEEEAQEVRRKARIKYNASLRRHKPSPKKELIRVRFFEEIKQLREDGFSWPNVARFLKEFRKASFGHSYLRLTYEALEKKRALETEDPNMGLIGSSQAQKAALAEEEAQEVRRRARIKYNAGLQRDKPSPKKELIRARFFEEIKQLREDGFSWRQVAIFLKEYHKESFGWTYLKTTYETLEKERAMEVEA